FTATVHDVCVKIREETKQQETDEIAKAKADGIQFFKLSEADMATLEKEAKTVYKEFAPEINKLYPGDTYRPADYLQEVQTYIGSGK
ncbi:MAG: C4-dicarboxylate ABC transporter substrate-binding protein, partial [Desulfobacterales bacterium]